MQNKTKLLKLFYADKNYAASRELCSHENSSYAKILTAKSYFYERDFKSAKEIFRRTKSFLEEGYCELFSGNVKKAAALWKKAPESSCCLWAKFSADAIMKGESNRIPTYLGIRNFYECDLDVLTEVGLFDYAEKLINTTEYLAEICPEVYKFTARVLSNRGLTDEALLFVEKSKDLIYKDSELHFLEGEIRLKAGDAKGAKACVERILSIDKNYYPAKVLDEKINCWQKNILDVK